MNEFIYKLGLHYMVHGPLGTEACVGPTYYYTYIEKIQMKEILNTIKLKG